MPLFDGAAEAAGTRCSDPSGPLVMLFTSACAVSEVDKVEHWVLGPVKPSLVHPHESGERSTDGGLLIYVETEERPGPPPTVAGMPSLLRSAAGNPLQNIASGQG